MLEVAYLMSEIHNSFYKLKNSVSYSWYQLPVSDKTVFGLIT
jgi:hypothetical protein